MPRKDGNPREISYAGKKFRYLTFGAEAKEAIVILQGWGLDASVYSYLAEELSAKDHFVVVPKLAGFGSPTIGRPNFYVWASQTCHLLDQLGVKKVQLVAHSMGGPVGLLIATNATAEKIILVGSAGIPQNRSQLGWVWIGIRNFFLNLADGGAKGVSFFGSLRPFWNSLRHPIWTYRSFLLTIRAEMRYLPWSIPDSQVFVIYGDRDLYFPWPSPQLLSNELGGKLIWKASWGHDALFIRPEEAAEEIEKILKGGR